MWGHHLHGKATEAIWGLLARNLSEHSRPNESRRGHVSEAFALVCSVSPIGSCRCLASATLPACGASEVAWDAHRVD